MLSPFPDATALAEELIIGELRRRLVALSDADLSDRSKRAAAYIAANVDPEHMLRFDAAAQRVEEIRRRAMRTDIEAQVVKGAA